MKKQAENINNWVTPDIPDFVQESHEEAWAKFLSLLDFPTKAESYSAWRDKTEEFWYKASIRYLIWNNCLLQVLPSQPKKNLICKL